MHGKEATMKVELWNLGDLKPYEGNPRVNDAAVDMGAESIRQFGYRRRRRRSKAPATPELTGRQAPFGTAQWPLR